MRLKRFIGYFRRNYSAVFIIVFLSLLWLCAVLIILNKERLAIVVGDWAFYFLIMGTGLRIIEMKLWK